MKIPFIVGIVISLMTACHPTKHDAFPSNLLESVTPVPEDTKTVVISAQHRIHVSVYVVDAVVWVQPTTGGPQRLTGINPNLYQDFNRVFFRIQDKDRDGFSEVGVLSGTNLGASELCYDVFRYALNGQFTRSWADFYCVKVQG